MSLDHAILGFLNRRPRSGYDLKTRCFDVEAKAFWTADQAQIYRTLERLKSMGLVSVSTRRQSGKPDRKVYACTAAGRDALATWIASTNALFPARDPFLLQAFFSGDASDDTIRAVFSAQRGLHQSRLDELRSAAIAAESDEPTLDRVTTMRQVAFDGAIAVERALIDWLDDTLEALADGLLPPRGDSGHADSHQALLGQVQS